MSNKDIIRLLKLTASLMELHEENDFKIRSYRNAVFNIEKTDQQLSSLSLKELESLDGIGKSMAAKITDMATGGTFPELEALLNTTPPGVVDLLNIKGVGPKKIRVLWKDLGIEDTEALLAACKEGKVAKLKGFGEKTQEGIIESLEYAAAQKGKFLFAEIEPVAIELEALLKAAGLKNISLSGEIRRYLEVVSTIQLICGNDDIGDVFAKINQVDVLEQDTVTSGPYCWRGVEKTMGCRVEIKVYPEAMFGNMLYLHSAGKNHLTREVKEGESVFQFAAKNTFSSEEQLAKALDMDLIAPELREGYGEIEQAQKHTLPKLIEESDLKGILHNHSTYSDGKHTLEEMAQHCKDLGYEYLGISDHSKSAFYANGLDEDRIIQQHEEIDALNKKLAPFKIFKGIESDILNDGSLDYSDDVLASFDFIVSSIHSNLGMDKAKATARLVKAIENPYTTILGHMTGRLLLRREGYPLDFEKVIDACAANGVIIEINANPWRLDIDWRWIPYALDKSVQLSINPDAHEKDGYNDMRYGVLVGRKGGLTKDMNFNSKGLDEVTTYFNKRKA